MHQLILPLICFILKEANIIQNNWIKYFFIFFQEQTSFSGLILGHQSNDQWIAPDYNELYISKPERVLTNLTHYSFLLNQSLFQG